MSPVIVALLAVALLVELLCAVRLRGPLRSLVMVAVALAALTAAQITHTALAR